MSLNHDQNMHNLLLFLQQLYHVKKLHNSNVKQSSPQKQGLMVTLNKIVFHGTIICKNNIFPSFNILGFSSIMPIQQLEQSQEQKQPHAHQQQEQQHQQVVKLQYSKVLYNQLDKRV